MTRPVKPARGAVDWKRVAAKMNATLKHGPWHTPEERNRWAQEDYRRALTRERKTNKAREGGGSR